jgi:hypothetical protein
MQLKIQRFGFPADTGSDNLTTEKHGPSVSVSGRGRPGICE